MQILCQPLFLLNLLIVRLYYVLKIRRLQCYKYTLRSYSRMDRRSNFKILLFCGYIDVGVRFIKHTIFIFCRGLIYQARICGNKKES
jgi:hypothetical protein